MPELTRRKGPDDLGQDTEGLELEQVFKGAIDIHAPREPRPAPKAPEPPPRMPVTETDEDTYVLRGAFEL